MKMHDNSTRYSKRKGCLHALILMVVASVFFISAGILFARDPKSDGALWVDVIFFIGFIGLFVSYLVQKRHFWIAGIISLFTCGTFPALFFYFWLGSHFSAAEKQLSVEPERIINAAFGFSFPNPGKGFVLESELPEEVKKLLAAQSSLFFWYMHDPTLSNIVQVAVAKGLNTKDEESFRKFSMGMQETMLNSSNITTQKDAVVWEPAKRAFRLNGKIEDIGRFVGIRCLASDSGAVNPFYVCVVTFSETESDLDFVRDGLVISDNGR